MVVPTTAPKLAINDLSKSFHTRGQLLDVIRNLARDGMTMLIVTHEMQFAEDVADFAAAGCTAMEVWLTKLEQHLETHSTAETGMLIADNGMTLAAGAYQGGLLRTLLGIGGV